jgi:DtxR family transcriptional regulator, Mn-dependent transcriptional regulator
MPPGRGALSTRAIDCLTLCHNLHERGERITTSPMRERLQHLAPSGQLSDAPVTQLMRELDDRGYVHHTPFRGVELTSEGELVAAQLVRRHHLLDLFLVKLMGFDFDTVDAEVERLDHAISDSAVDRVDALPGSLTEDPHGDPIPSRAGVMCTAPTQWPSELIPGQQAVVRRVSDETPAELRYLGTPELLPGVQITLRELAPLGEPLRIHVGDPGGGQEHTVGPQLADAIGVVVVEDTEAASEPH